MGKGERETAAGGEREWGGWGGCGGGRRRPQWHRAGRGWEVVEWAAFAADPSLHTPCRGGRAIIGRALTNYYTTSYDYM